MSTTAPSPREVEEQPRTNRWLEYVGEDDVTSLADRIRVEGQSFKPSSPVDLDRVERLLNHLEARSMALAKYGYAHSPRSSRPASNKVTLLAVLLALWLSVVGSFFVYVRLTSGKQSIRQDSIAGGRIISPMPSREERKAVGSFDHLAKSLASPSKKLNQLEAKLELSKKGLQRMASPAIESPAAAALSDSNGVRQIQPSDSAVPHKNAEGTVDYWVLPHGPRNSSSARIFFVGKVANGVVVRSLEDNSYYTLTPKGEWRGIRISGLAN